MAKGDALASGGVKAQFPPAGGNVTQDKWDSIFEKFTPEEAPKPVEKTKKEKRRHVCSHTCNVSE